jgi:small subunit ribosomal protein S4
MARYTGPTTRLPVNSESPFMGPDKYFEKKNYPPEFTA